MPCHGETKKLWKGIMTTKQPVNSLPDDMPELEDLDEIGSVSTEPIISMPGTNILLLTDQKSIAFKASLHAQMAKESDDGNGTAIISYRGGDVENLYIATYIAAWKDGQEHVEMQLHDDLPDIEGVQSINLAVVRIDAKTTTEAELRGLLRGDSPPRFSAWRQGGKRSVLFIASNMEMADNELLRHMKGLSKRSTIVYGAYVEGSGETPSPTGATNQWLRACQAYYSKYAIGH